MPISPVALSKRISSANVRSMSVAARTENPPYAVDGANALLQLPNLGQKLGLRMPSYRDSRIGK